MSRQPFADATATLGTVHKTQQNRDAVHLACCQVELANTWELTHACLLTINSDGKAVPTDNFEKSVGILDPFIQDVYDLSSGDKVWLILHPGMITSLRHVWEHPSFPATSLDMTVEEHVLAKKELELSNVPEDKQESYSYILEVAENLNLTFDELLTEAYRRKSDPGHYYTGGSEAEGFSIGDSFWDHFENYTNTIMPKQSRDNFISCSC